MVSPIHWRIVGFQTHPPLQKRDIYWIKVFCCAAMRLIVCWFHFQALAHCGVVSSFKVLRFP
jgi:hypothetical protein